MKKITSALTKQMLIAIAFVAAISFSACKFEPPIDGPGGPGNGGVFEPGGPGNGGGGSDSTGAGGHGGGGFGPGPR